MKVTIYPYSINKGDIRVNPYISDFIHALQQNGITIANPPHKNPLFASSQEKQIAMLISFIGRRMYPTTNMECCRLLLLSGFFSKLNATIRRSSGSCTISSPM